MNKDRVKGRIEEAKGNKVKQVTGNVVGDGTLEKGKVKKAAAAFKRAMAISRMN